MKIFKTYKSKLSDEELLNKFKSTKDSEYFGVLYSRYIPLVYGVCLKYLNSVENTEDAVMQIFENLLRKINDYEIEQFKYWLYGVSKNHCLQIIRKNKKTIELDFNDWIMESDIELDLFDESEEHSRYLNECIELLPETQKISVYNFYLKEMSYLEVAECTGYNLKSVKSYIQNGRRNLKNCIEKKRSE